MPEDRAAFLGHKIFQAAISAFGLLPFPFQFELVEAFDGHDIAAAFAQAMKPAVFNGPSFRREWLLFWSAPAVCRLSIKEQLPAARLFFFGELIGRSIRSKDFPRERTGAN